MKGNRLPLHTEPGFVASGLNVVVVGKPVARTHLEIILAASPWGGALRLSVYMVRLLVRAEKWFGYPGELNVESRGTLNKSLYKTTQYNNRGRYSGPNSNRVEATQEHLEQS